MTNEINIYDAKELNTATIKKFLKGGGQASDDELAMLLALSRNLNMNPFMKEVYFVKYGTSPAQIVVSRDFYRKRAFSNPNFAGLEVGVIVQEQDGTIKSVEGAFKTRSQELVGAWARVHIRHTEIPVYVAVAYDEYVQMKNGQPNSMWAAKPCTMLAKVAESQALRMAFPSEFSGTYGEEEYPEQPKRREVNGIEEPTQDEINNFDKEEFTKNKMAQLEAQKAEREAKKKSQEVLDVNPETGEIEPEVTAEDF